MINQPAQVTLVSHQTEDPESLLTQEYQAPQFGETDSGRDEEIITPEDLKHSEELKHNVSEAQNKEDMKKIHDSKESDKSSIEAEESSYAMTIPPSTVTIHTETPNIEHKAVQNQKFESHHVGNVIDYLYFTNNLSESDLKVVDSEYLKSSQSDPSKVLDSYAIKAVGETDAVDLEKQDETEKDSSNNLTPIAVLAKLLFIVFYYSDIVSNYWTTEMMIGYELYWYFGILAFFLLATWCSNIKFNFRDIANPYKAFFLGITQLEEIYFQFCYKESDIDPRKKSEIEARNNPLTSREFYQILFNNFPMAFVMVHLMCVMKITDLVVQLSIIITILTACLFLMYIIISYDKSFRTINLKKIYLLFGVGLHASLEMSGLLYLWGFYAALTKPWGALLFFPFSLILWFIICGMLEGTSKVSIDYMLYTSFSPVASTYRVGFYLRLVQFVFFIIVFIAKQGELAIILADTIWFWYFVVGWGCTMLWLANSLYFYSSLKSTKENDILFSTKNTVIKRNCTQNEDLSERLLVDE